MNTDREFLDLIRADWDNPVPRLVYADWLDEQGDPRGEFIRVQCELERSELSALKRRWLRQREEELLEDYQADWLEPVAGKNLTSAQWRFRRGFVEEVSIDSREYVERSDELHAAFPLLHVLNLEGLSQSRVQPLVDCPALRNVSELRFTTDFGRGANIEFDHYFREVLDGPAIQKLLSSPHFENLRFLNLADASLEDAEIRGVLACANLNLHSFDLSRNQILPTGIRLGLDTFQCIASARCMRNLQELILRTNRLSINHVLLLTYSDQLKNLHRLDLSGNPLGSQSNMIALVGLERFPRLTRLNLSSCGIGDAGVAALVKTALWRPMGSLFLWNNDITDQGLIAIAEAEPPAKLKALELQRNLISDAGLTALAASPVLRSFHSLHLEHNRIGDAGIANFVRTDHGQSLQSLHLRGNLALTDRGGMALAESAFPQLETLDLAGTQVGDLTSEALAHSGLARPLRVLDLAGTRITDDGAQHLITSENLNSLEFLDLRMNRLSENCVAALRGRFGRRVLL